MSFIGPGNFVIKEQPKPKFGKGLKMRALTPEEINFIREECRLEDSDYTAITQYEHERVHTLQVNQFKATLRHLLLPDLFYADGHDFADFVYGDSHEGTNTINFNQYYAIIDDIIKANYDNFEEVRYFIDGIDYDNYGHVLKGHIQSKNSIGQCLLYFMVPEVKAKQEKEKEGR